MKIFYIFSLLFLIVIINIFSIYSMETMQNNIEKPIFFFVITLKHENRLKNIENQQKKIKEKEIILFEAVKGDFINMDDLIKEKILDPNFKEEGVRKRVIGCYMSHLNMYKKILKYINFLY